MIATRCEMLSFLFVDRNRSALLTSSVSAIEPMYPAKPPPPPPPPRSRRIDPSMSAPSTLTGLLLCWLSHENVVCVESRAPGRRGFLGASGTEYELSGVPGGESGGVPDTSGSGVGGSRRRRSAVIGMCSSACVICSSIASMIALRSRSRSWILGVSACGIEAASSLGGAGTSDTSDRATGRNGVEG